MLTLYQQQDSGNCYKPRMLLAILGLPFRVVDIDANRGQTRTADYLARNPNGKVLKRELRGRYADWLTRKERA